MPVVGVASKLRPPSSVGTKPVHTALPIPSAVRAATSQGYMARQQELRAGEGTPGLSCQLSVKSEYRQERTPDGRSRAETEESKICKGSTPNPSVIWGRPGIRFPFHTGDVNKAGRVLSLLYSPLTASGAAG
ncbi:unnamed protein product [Pleuronectes platessa]|uniref:Uncharacterized protein n=1 Tax=Pleuronectes platessa TaxID=8262 RepID=A0A9N7YJU2_PLEPL|nr:unnamed protein product [Pleuronectes platessa]